VRTTEELLEWKSSGSDLENRGNSLRWPHNTLYQQMLALTSPTSGGRSVGIYIYTSTPIDRAKWAGFCGFRDHPLSLLSTSACDTLWKQSITPNNVTEGASCGKPLKRMGRQYATWLTSFRALGILGATGLRHAINVMLQRYITFSKPAIRGQMPFKSKVINSLSTHILFVYTSFHVFPVALLH
jgi:hypothetical protein